MKVPLNGLSKGKIRFWTIVTWLGVALAFGLIFAVAR